MAEAARIYCDWADRLGIPITVVSGYRSLDEQLDLYRKGRTPAEIASRVSKHGAGGTVTDAYPGSSPHNYGLAFDVESAKPNDARALASKLGFGLVSWDLPHIEWPNWRSLLG
jgi:LAS superfamily LD-carboxypeptidase LdcB